MSKIVIDARIINSGTGRYVERLLRYLQKLDHKNQYIILTPSKDKDYWQPDKTATNFQVSACDIKNYSFDEQTIMSKFLKTLNPDLVHFCMPQQPLFYRGKSITTFHDLTLLKTYNRDKNWLNFKSKQLVGRLVFLTAAKKNTAIITPTQFTKDELVKFAHIKPDKVTVTYEAADIDQATTTKDQALALTKKVKHPNFLLYVGKQSTYKNVRRLAAAHQKLLYKYPDLGLLLVGGIDRSVELNQRWMESRKFRNIQFLDKANDGQLKWLYAHSAAYVFPSFMEGFGLPGLEAMSVGAPVVSSNATCLPEVYGEAALYFDPKSVDDMVTKIDRVLSEPQVRKRLIKKGLEQVQKYSWPKMAEQTLAVYQKVLNSK